MQCVQPYRYKSPNIPLSAVKRFVRRIVEKFQPDKVILFGSYAYGTPHDWSDIDLLVIMPCRNEIDQAIRIDNALDAPFSLDLIVRTPYHIRIGLNPDDRDWFLWEITEKGKVLYEALNRSVGAQSRRGHGGSKKPRRKPKTKSGRSRVPLPTGGREVPESDAPGTRRARTAHPRVKATR